MRLLIWLLLAYFAYRWIKGKRAAEIGKTEKIAATDTHLDPVCGVYVPQDSAVVGRLNGEKIYFCSMACLERFEKEQQKR